MGPLAWIATSGAGLLIGRMGVRLAQRAMPVVENGKLSGRYGVQRTESHVHNGIDIAAPKGSKVRAVADGVVDGVYPDCDRRGYGNCVLLQHDDGMLSFYAHLEAFRPGLAPGDRIKQGQVIGYVGATNCGLQRSRPMASHLHLEIHSSVVRGPSGRAQIAESMPDRLDPEAYLRERGVLIQSYVT